MVLPAVPGVEAVHLPDDLSTVAVVGDGGVQEARSAGPAVVELYEDLPGAGDPTVGSVPNVGITPVVIIDLNLLNRTVAYDYVHLEDAVVPGAVGVVVGGPGVVAALILSNYT